MAQAGHPALAFGVSQSKQAQRTNCKGCHWALGPGLGRGTHVAPGSCGREGGAVVFSADLVLQQVFGEFHHFQREKPLEDAERISSAPIARPAGIAAHHSLQSGFPTFSGARERSWSLGKAWGPRNNAPGRLSAGTRPLYRELPPPRVTFPSPAPARTHAKPGPACHLPGSQHTRPAGGAAGNHFVCKRGGKEKKKVKLSGRREWARAALPCTRARGPQGSAAPGPGRAQESGGGGAGVASRPGCSSRGWRPQG